MAALWHKMEQHLRNNPRHTISQLCLILLEILYDFSPNLWQYLVYSIPAKIRALVQRSQIPQQFRRNMDLDKLAYNHWKIARNDLHMKNVLTNVIMNLNKLNNSHNLRLS